jgi:hypothetical protein
VRKRGKKVGATKSRQNNNLRPQTSAFGLTNPIIPRNKRNKPNKIFGRKDGSLKMWGITQFRPKILRRCHRFKVQGTMLLKHNASHARTKPPNFVHIRLATPLACSGCGTFVVCARYGELFKTSEPVVRAVFGLSVFPSVRENKRRKQRGNVYGQKDDGVGAV